MPVMILNFNLAKYNRLHMLIPFQECIACLCILDLDVSLFQRDMKPPASTKSAIYAWNQKIVELSKQIGVKGVKVLDLWKYLVPTVCSPLLKAFQLQLVQEKIHDDRI